MANINVTVFLLVVHCFVFLSHSFPLSTNSRWIVDENSGGQRVKLACVNWPGHLHVMIPEGLDKKPVNAIAADISRMGFNCVRLTWATYMYTRPENANATVLDLLDRWNLTTAKRGVAENNPRILEQSLADAQKAVIDALGAAELMVVLDNHVSLPQWCCGGDDGNGFFGDVYFDPEEWVLGLATVARRYAGNSAVVAMSLRNELRGSRQNPNDWYKYMQHGATTIHEANPDLLVILSGLYFDTNLWFLKDQPLTIDLDNKLVFEAHWYSFGQPIDKWTFQTNEFCANVNQVFMNNVGFLSTTVNNSVPLFLSEIGIDQRGENEADNRYFSCLLATIAGEDMDWALWTLAGSFMLREGKMDVEDVYGMYDFGWGKLRNATMLQRLTLIQTKIQDPKSSDPPFYIMYHPQSGLCIEASKNKITAKDCRTASPWAYEKDVGSIRLVDTSQCLAVVGPGLEPVLSDDCFSQQSMWSAVSSSKHHLAAEDDRGKILCLELDYASSKFVTKECLCLGDDMKDLSRCEENPQIQWFKLIPNYSASLRM